MPNEDYLARSAVRSCNSKALCNRLRCFSKGNDLALAVSEVSAIVSDELAVAKVNVVSDPVDG